jgi:hypothetical protein
MCHYLPGTAGAPDGVGMSAGEWNRHVDSVDADRLAGQLEEAGAGYLLFTVGQNSGHYCSPNPVYDEIVGRRPGLCSRRDLVADLSAALARRGIPLLAYLPSAAPCFDPLAIERLEWDPRRRTDPAKVPGRLERFQRKWEAVVREWSARWGKRVRGWWIDGCYRPNLVYAFDDDPNFNSFAAALRAGNPESILAFNDGMPRLPMRRVTEQADYTGGHSDVRELYTKHPRWVEGAQFHILEFLGEAWGAGTEPRYPGEFLAAYIRYICAPEGYGIGPDSFRGGKAFAYYKEGAEGVVTLDVPISLSGQIPGAFIRALATVKRAVRAGT